MASIISICNLALTNIGKNNISALTEQTAEARVCAQFYNQTRLALLEDYPWRFAGKIVSLAETDNDRVGDWGYSYQQPADYVKARTIRPDFSLVDARPKSVYPDDEYQYPYDIDGGLIYCDLSPAILRYTFDQQDATRFTASFVDALSWHLASRMAIPLTKDVKLRSETYKAATMYQSKAEVHDANQTRETSDRESVFVAGRN